MKKFLLTYADEALLNLREIVAFIGKDNIQKAIEYRQGVEKVISNLSEFPYSGKQVGKSKSERVCFYWNHKIYYSVKERSETVEIKYISHSTMKERE